VDETTMKQKHGLKPNLSTITDMINKNKLDKH